MLESGYLKVDELHSIYYERCGKQGNNPILFVHGGPGAGFTEYDKRFFDFSKQEVIFFDQRGSSRSKPFGEIRNNTIQYLGSDILKLIDHLQIESVHLFGGSWGTTLSLFFAINHPHKVKSLLLRAVFLGDKKSIFHFINGGTEEKCPEQWNRFIQPVPEYARNEVGKYYLTKILNGTEEERERFSYEWSYYEISLLHNNSSEEEIDKIIRSYSYKSLAIMEAFYLSNNCFLTDDFILKSINKIEDIPCVIVHGINDNICPFEQAVILDSKLKNSTIYLEKAGHSDRDKAIEKRITEALNSMC